MKKICGILMLTFATMLGLADAALATITLPTSFVPEDTVSSFWDAAWPALEIVLGLWLAIIIIKFIMKVVRRVFQ